MYEVLLDDDDDDDDDDDNNDDDDDDDDVASNNDDNDTYICTDIMSIQNQHWHAIRALIMTHQLCSLSRSE